MSAVTGKQAVRWNGLRMRTVSDVTLRSSTTLTPEDRSAIALLRKTASSAASLRTLKGTGFGQIEEVSSRTLHNWKLDYVKRLLRPMRLVSALADSVEVFSSLNVGFHNDAYAVSSSMFCAAVIAGPARDVVFPHIGVRYTLEPGVMVAFDPALVHALLPVGAEVLPLERPAKIQEDDVTVFLSAELSLTPGVLKRFRLDSMDEAEARHQNLSRPDLASFCPQTGVLQ